MIILFPDNFLTRLKMAINNLVLKNLCLKELDSKRTKRNISVQVLVLEKTQQCRECLIFWRHTVKLKTHSVVPKTGISDIKME